MNEATLLYVSDDPEGFKDHGRLFDAMMPSDGRTIRLLFDHVNKMPVQMRVLVGVTNVGSTKASVQVRGGVAGPGPSGIDVGHMATLRYLRAFKSSTVGASSTHTIAIGASYIIFDAIVPDEACVAGIYDLVGVGHLKVSVIACDPEHDALTVADLLPVAPSDGKHRRGIFELGATASANTILDVSHGGDLIIGNAATTYPRASEDPYGGSRHLGEYGVLKHITLQAGAQKNEQRLALVLSPRGGGASATIIADNAVVELTPTNPPARRKLLERTISADVPFTMEIVTMSEINSTYPVHLALVVDDGMLADVDAADSGVKISPLVG